MHVRSCLLVVALVSCGGGKSSSHDDAAVTRDGSGSGSGTPTETDVTGVIGGTPFELRYAAVSWSPPGDPRIWVCAASVPVTYSECMQSGGPDRVMVFGPFTYDQTGSPRWDIAELFQYRVGTNPTTELARSGSITVFEDSSATNTLTVAFSIDFGGTQPTMGTITSH